MLASVPHTGTQFTSKLMLSHPDIDNVYGLDKVYALDVTPDMHMVKGHFGLYDASINYLAAKMPTITPLRDPLASLLSIKKRSPNRANMQMLKSWKSFFLFTTSNKPYYLPVDLLAKLSPGERQDCCDDLFWFLGLSTPPHELKAIDAWEKENSVERTSWDEAYEQGDLRYMKTIMPDEVDGLMKLQPFLQPFLEKQGYTDLAWYQ